jgi:dihydroxyacetone kinase
MELYLMVNAARGILAGRGLKVVGHLTGSLVNPLEMAGG